MATDLFKEMKNALLDLQSSQFQTYQRPLKTLARLLQNPDLAEVNAKLTEGLDLDKFLGAQTTRGGLVGSDTFDWPDDPREALGLTLLMILRFAEKPELMLTFGHSYYHSGNKLSDAVHSVVRQLLIPFLRDYKSYVEGGDDGSVRLVLPAAHNGREARLTGAGSNKVFIVHGHDDDALHGLARFLERLKLEPIVLREQPNQGRTIIEKYEDIAGEVGFALVLLTPDDVGAAKAATEQNQRARQNVIFELGYFAGHLGRGRVCLLRKGSVEIPSDLYGVLYIDLDPSEGWKSKLVQEMKAAKLDFDANRMFG
ncbi:putative nucleotide-binding protein containing TIR-like domain [Mesorhizobium australicum WSM2073]|uniref:Putative nucleotide-binding protein containing TIR-like domain n=1 Tax=Mesorhizobium australicum (strain HAMBI 3006 / LMG 24608 / WSM2073) TaxID=754035 RepID=L0KD27_MESAW|nr:nucleotide-binding protein [Mesorhizobium australicum]AGB43217.1 putative nucleotide-binding protein containing TIR-like domain [Mesorhizobium australicum WSM2073]